jgi:hypothetical protein
MVQTPAVEVVFRDYTRRTCEWRPSVRNQPEAADHRIREHGVTAGAGDEARSKIETGSVICSERGDVAPESL